MEDVTMRFALHVEEVMQRGDLETVQNEVVLFSSLLMQDALADQTMQPDEVAHFRDRIASILYAHAGPASDAAKANLDAIVALYAPEDAALDQDVDAALTGLMADVVAWLDSHAAPIPVA